MKEPKDHSKRTRWGLIVSGLWVGLSVVLAFTVGDGQLKLNELGDFIAGMIAPLAFLWLIIGYFQQGEEIRANTEELERQEQVMREQARAMEIAATSLAEHTRPYITVNFITEGIGVRLVLENIGSRPAQRVQIEYDPPHSEI